MLQTRTGRVAVSCRVRPLLGSEVTQGVARASWVLTDKSVALSDKCVPRLAAAEGRYSDLDGGPAWKTRGELRDLNHLRRETGETVMDNVFGESATTREVYDQAFRGIVAGVAEGFNGAIMAYGQTASGKTYSISGASAPSNEGGRREEGIIDFALQDLFTKFHEQANSSGGSGGQGNGREYLVRMSYCELYMERVNDLLRKISPQSQNLPVKEDAEGKGFYVEGLKEKIVGSAEEVIGLLHQAEKRRRVAYTRFNEVSSRSHTILTLAVECSMPLEPGPEGVAESSGGRAADDDSLPRVTRVGRLVIVDLAGNERVEAGTEYMAESSSINQSLFFLGKVIERLASRERRRSRSAPSLHAASDTSNDFGGGDTASTSCGSIDFVPIRDSKLTRLLSVHLGGNSQTGLLVTMTPAEDAIEQSLTTLRFAQKAGQVRCVPKPVVVSKEQSLILKQREIIAQLRNQVQELQGAPRNSAIVAGEGSSAPACSGDGGGASASSVAASKDDQELAEERRERVEQLQALTMQPSSSPSRQAFVSKSREVDAVVTALHRNNDALKRQKATVIEQLQQMHRVVTDVSRQLQAAVAELRNEHEADGCESRVDIKELAARLQAPKAVGGQAAAWRPAVDDLCTQIRELLHLAVDRGAAMKTGTLLQASGSPCPPANIDDGRQLREENARLRASLKYLAAERERLKAVVAQPNVPGDSLGDTKAQSQEASTPSVEVSEPALPEKCSKLENSSEKVASRQEDTPRKRSDGSDAGIRWSPSPKLGSRGLLDSRGSLAWGAFRGGGSTTSPGAASSGSRTPSRATTRASAGGGGSGVSTAASDIVAAQPGTSAGGGEPRPATGRCSSELDLRSVCSSTPSPTCGLGECEPIVERLERRTSPLRKTLSRSGGLGEFEPVIERCAPLPPPGPPARSSKTPPPPSCSASGAPRIAQAYFRQLGVRTSWQPGDVAYWRGQACRVVRCLPEEQPLCVVLRTPEGNEVSTDLCLLSEAPASVYPAVGTGGAEAASGSGGSEFGRPLRLAPLGDLCIDRPMMLERPNETTSQLVHQQLRPPTLPSPRLGQQQQQQQQQGRLGARSLSGGRNSCGRTGSPLALQPLSQAERGQRPPSGGSSSVATPTSTSRRSTSQSRFAPLSLCSGGLL